MTMQMQAIANQSVTEQQSLVLVRNLIRTAISSIAYIRHIFPEDCFSDRLLSGLSVKTLLPSSSESKLVMQWLEQGVFEALEKKYLKSLVFGMYFDPQNESTLIECYKFCISYNQDQHAVLVVRENANAADKGNGKSTKSVSNQMMTKDGIKQATIAMIRTLISLAQTLTPIPKTRYLVMKLYYYDEITPTDYEPKFFRPATEDEALAFHFKPLRLSLGSVNTPYHQFALQIRTTVDCVDKLSALAAEHRTKANFAIDEQKNQNEVEVEEQEQEQEENEDQNINKADQSKEIMKKIEEEPKKSKNKDKTEETMKAQKRKRFDEEQEDLNQNVTLNKKNEKLIEKDELKNINISENNKEFDKKNSELISKIEIKQETSENNKGKKRKRFDEEQEQEQEFQQKEKILEQKQTTPQKQITPQNQVPHIVLPAPCNHNSQLKSDQIENIQNSPISSPNLLEISNQQFAFVEADRKEEKIENSEKNGSNSKKQNEKTNSIQKELEKEDSNKQHQQQQQQPILKASQNAPIVADIEDLESTQKDTETESDSLVDPSECISHTDHSGSRSGLEVPSTQSIMQMSLSSQLNAASPGCIVTQTEMHGIYHHNSQSQQSSSSSSSYMNTEQIAAAIQADTCDIQQQQQTESQSESQQQTIREGNVIKCSVICDPVLQGGQLQQQQNQQCLQHPKRSSLPIVSSSFSSGQSSATAAALAALAPQKRNSNSNARTGYGRFMRMSEE